MAAAAAVWYCPKDMVQVDLEGLEKVLRRVGRIPAWVRAVGVGGKRPRRVWSYHLAWVRLGRERWVELGWKRDDFKDAAELGGDGYPLFRIDEDFCPSEAVPLAVETFSVGRARSARWCYELTVGTPGEPLYVGWPQPLAPFRACVLLPRASLTSWRGARCGLHRTA